MRITVDLDDEIVSAARELTGIREPNELVREGLRLLVQRETARRLARLGGSEPRLGSPRRPR